MKLGLLFIAYCRFDSRTNGWEGLPEIPGTRWMPHPGRIRFLRRFKALRGSRRGKRAVLKHLLEGINDLNAEQLFHSPEGGEDGLHMRDVQQESGYS